MIEETLLEAEEKMDKAVEVAKEDFAAIRTGRANPALFAKRATILAKAGEDLVKASKTHDVRTFYRVSSGLDDTCDGCHQPFWGTDEPPPVSKAVRAMRPIVGR